MEKKQTRRKFLQSIVGIGVAGIAGLVDGCKEKEGIVKKEKFTLYVTEGRYPKYCGMPNEKHFSLSWQGYDATNLYYPKDAKQINFFGTIYEVVFVDPNIITLRKIKK